MGRRFLEEQHSLQRGRFSLLNVERDVDLRALSRHAGSLPRAKLSLQRVPFPPEIGSPGLHRRLARRRSSVRDATAARDDVKLAALRSERNLHPSPHHAGETIPGPVLLLQRDDRPQLHPLLAHPRRTAQRLPQGEGEGARRQCRWREIEEAKVHGSGRSKAPLLRRHVRLSLLVPRRSAGSAVSCGLPSLWRRQRGHGHAGAAFQLGPEPVSLRLQRLSREAATGEGATCGQNRHAGSAR